MKIRFGYKSKVLPSLNQIVVIVLSYYFVGIFHFVLLPIIMLDQINILRYWKVDLFPTVLLAQVPSERSQGSALICSACDGLLAGV